MHSHMTDWFPILRWGRTYDRGLFAADLTASAVVTLLLIPQSLAYAMLAGMPPVTGLYASILPLLAYAALALSPLMRGLLHLDYRLAERDLRLMPMAVVEGGAVLAMLAALHPLQRLGQPQDAAALAAFLISQQAGWITGQVIGVDGGRSRLRPKG